MTKDKFEVMEICNKRDIPCGPILSMKELAERAIAARHRHGRRGRPSDARQVPLRRQSDQALRQPGRGRRSPLLGEHTEEVLREVLKFDDQRISEIQESGAIGELQRQAAE